LLDKTGLPSLKNLLTKLHYPQNSHRFLNFNCFTYKSHFPLPINSLLTPSHLSFPNSYTTLSSPSPPLTSLSKFPKAKFFINARKGALVAFVSRKISAHPNEVNPYSKTFSKTSVAKPLRAKRSGNQSTHPGLQPDLQRWCSEEKN